MMSRDPMGDAELQTLSYSDFDLIQLPECPGISCTISCFSLYIVQHPTTLSTALYTISCCGLCSTDAPPSMGPERTGPGQLNTQQRGAMEGHDRQLNTQYVDFAFVLAGVACWPLGASNKTKSCL